MKSTLLLSKFKNFTTFGKFFSTLLLALSTLFVKGQMITTVAGNGTHGITASGPISPSTMFQFIDEIEFDPSGNLYVCTNENKIFKITPGGVISVFAGNGGFPATGDGGLATAAGIGRVYKIVFDPAGNAYFTSPGTHRVRKINTSGIISTIAGNGVMGFAGDGGLATSANIAFPIGIALDATGNIYFVDGQASGAQSGKRIRKINAGTGIITTMAGTGTTGNTGDGGLATLADIDAFAMDINAGNLYLTNSSSTIRKINLGTGIITRYAGNGTNGYSGDGGSALLAQFEQIMDLELDAAGNLYVNHWIFSPVIRKINTLGIVSTFAGNGTPGFSGDGGSPLFALLNAPHALAISSSGNEVYIGDESNYRIRKVDVLATPLCPNTLSVLKNRGANGLAVLTPSISPFLGTPTYFGNLTGNPLINPLMPVNFTTSTTYTQTFPGNGIYKISVTYDDTISGFHCVRNKLDTILINNSLTPKKFKRGFSPSNNYFCNSGNVSFVDSTRLIYSLGSTLATYTIITNWGNGSTVTNTVNAISQISYTSATTSYTNPGVYTIQSIIKGIGMANDTAFRIVQVDMCGGLNGIVYHDANGDCSHLFSEIGIPTLAVTLTNATNSFMVWSNAAGYYAFSSVPVGTYTVKVNGSVSGYTTVCVGSMPHLVTISSTVSVSQDFAMTCGGGFDIATTGISLSHGFFPGQINRILPHVGILNGTCNFVIPGKVKMVLTPCVTYVPGGVLVNPPSLIIPAATGDTLVWNVSDINNIGNFGYYNYAVSVATCTSAVVGSTACIKMIVLPTSGDVNITNNTFTRCFVIGVAYDPNYKEVTPKGTGVDGSIPASTNDLTYTLHFQNTGTAMATNIYLLDTISTNLDLYSIEIVSASHSLVPYLLSGRTMKFMFPYINLPDSNANEELSHGYVTYRIKLNSGLAPGTKIKNTGYIYFDYNAPVVTNTALNTIETLAGFKEFETKNNFSVYPNPAQDRITIGVSENTPSNIVISDILGKELMQVQTNELQTEINVSSLKEGVYFIKVSQNGNTFVQKLVIGK